jgi:CubicO group peptidase (beta-lactamase class C family)
MGVVEESPGQPTSGVPVSGWCDPAFAPVTEAFRDNFVSRGELGAGVSISVGGRVVVDLAGGWRDQARTRPWTTDTLVNVFSVGKGLTAAVVAALVAEGRLDVDAPVSRWWPDFGAAGKGEVTVAQLLSHQAGLPAVHDRLPRRAMLDHELMAQILALEEPWWEPGTQHGYHVNTFGFLVGELVRRASGSTVGTLLREHFGQPLDADVHIGLPDSEHGRVADFVWTEAAAAAIEQGEAGLTQLDLSSLTVDQLMEFNAYRNPPGFSGIGFVNAPEWRRVEIPSTNGHASATGVQRVYAALAGALFGHSEAPVVPRSVLELFTTEQVNGDDVILHRPSRFGLGFQLTQPQRPLGPGPHAFGHFGAGGSLGFADPDLGLAFGYVVNLMGPRWQNPRNGALIEALSACLAD